MKDDAPKKKTARKKSAKKSTKKKVSKCKYGFKNIKPPQLIEKWTGIQKHDPQYKNPNFWSLQMKILRQLCDKYPAEFVEKLELPYAVESLIVLKSDFHRRYIRRKYREYTYVPAEETIVEVGKERVAKKINYKKRKSIKSFLMEGKDKKGK